MDWLQEVGKKKCSQEMEIYYGTKTRYYKDYFCILENGKWTGKMENYFCKINQFKMEKRKKNNKLLL